MPGRWSCQKLLRYRSQIEDRPKLPRSCSLPDMHSASFRLLVQDTLVQVASRENRDGDFQKFGATKRRCAIGVRRGYGSGRSASDEQFNRESQNVLLLWLRTRSPIAQLVNELLNFTPLTLY